MTKSAILFPSPWFRVHDASITENIPHMVKASDFLCSTHWHKVTHSDWLCLTVLQEHICKCNCLLFFLFGNGAQIPNISNSLIILFVTYILVYMCMCVCVLIYICAHVYVYVYVCACSYIYELLYNYHCGMTFSWTLGFIVLVFISCSWGFHTFAEINPQITYPENGY